MNRVLGRQTTAFGVSLFVAITCLCPSLLAWHGEGHAKVTLVAVKALPDVIPDFIRKGGDAIAHSAVDPDLFTRPIGPPELHRTEAPEHYFDLERLGEMPIPPSRTELLMWCGKHDVRPRDVGLLPYAIVEWTQRLSVALSEHRRWPDNPHVRNKALVYAGMLCHYAQDLCQPLHTTVHYDGRAKADGTSPHSGIHRKVDNLLGKLPATLRIDIPPDAVQPLARLLPELLAALRRSHALVDRVYELESVCPAYGKPLPATGAITEFTAERFKASARLSARLIVTAWRDSGRIKLPHWHTRPVDGVANPGPATRPKPTLVTRGPKPDAATTGQTIRVATYNIEHFMRMFDQARMPERSRDMGEFYRDDEDLYEVARVIKLPTMRPDILAIQECCSQAMLERFNAERLGGAYAFVKVFPGNVAGQFLGMLARPGFEPLEVRDQYFKDVDPVDDPQVRPAKRHAHLDKDNLLFSRGPAFVKFRVPGGKDLWVGVTHAKSKYGNSSAVTRWRFREIERSRAICEELLRTGDTDLLLLCGDFNDDFGMDPIEQELGRDAIATMLEGEATERLVCLTKKLAEAPAALASYHCEIKPRRYRSFIDHFFASPAAAALVKEVRLIDDPIAAVASDHYPVVAVLVPPSVSPGEP